MIGRWATGVQLAPLVTFVLLWRSGNKKKKIEHFISLLLLFQVIYWLLKLYSAFIYAYILKYIIMYIYMKSNSLIYKMCT